jgi:hypothetical protein
VPQYQSTPIYASFNIFGFEILQTHTCASVKRTTKTMRGCIICKIKALQMNQNKIDYFKNKTPHTDLLYNKNT